MGLLEALRRKEPVLPLDLSLVYDRTIVDEPDSRNAIQHQNLARAIRDYQSPENPRKREEVFVFEEERRRQPDYYLPVYWVARSFMDKKNYGAAVEVLREGIAKCKIKGVLCRLLGQCYFGLGDLEKSIYWFCTAIMAGEDKDYHSHLYLGYMYEALGMKEASWWIRRRARGISYVTIGIAMEYDPRSIDVIEQFAREHRTERAVQMLETFYRYAEKKLGYL